MTETGTSAGGATVHRMFPGQGCESGAGDDGVAETAEEHEARLRELRERVARGEYEIDPYEVARAIMERGL